MKTLSLLLAVIMAVLFIVTPTEYAISQGVSESSSAITRITYQVFHLNIFHLIINIYAILSLAFMAGARIWQFVASFLIAALIPNVLIGGTPMLGMSILNFALSGMIIMNSRKWKSLFIINAIIIAPSFLLANVAALAHLYALAAGTIVGFATTKRFE